MGSYMALGCGTGVEAMQVSLVLPSNLILAAILCSGLL